MEFFGQRAQQVTIPIDDLKVDHANYQRPAVEASVRKITRDFDPQALGGIVVNRRGDGSYFVIDGQQRVEALRRMEHVTVDCLVLTGLTIVQEARLFQRLNGDRTGVDALGLFKSRLAYGEPEAIEIDAIARRHGYKVQKHHGEYLDGIAAVRALEKVYRLGGAGLLDRTLAVIRAAWEGESDATHSYSIAGVGAFIKHYDGLFDTARLVARLSTKRPTVILRRADAALSRGKGYDFAFAIEVVALYNWKLQGHRLPAWGDVETRPRDSALRLSA